MAGIDSTALGITAAGGFLVWSGIRNVGVVNGLRSLLAGRIPTEGQQVVTTGPTAAVTTSGVGGALVAEARRHIGARYVWATEGPTTFDCSGLIYFSLNAIGVKAPRLTAAGYMAWSGAVTINRADMQPGDLCCWGGHIGIASSATTMIEAANQRVGVREGNIWTVPAPVIRRVLGGGATSSATAAEQRLRQGG